MKLLKALWDLIFDHRTGLLLSGALLSGPLLHALKKGDWADVAVCAVLSVWGIWSAWPKLAVRA